MIAPWRVWLAGGDPRQADTLPVIGRPIPRRLPWWRRWFR